MKAVEIAALLGATSGVVLLLRKVYLDTLFVGNREKLGWEGAQETASHQDASRAEVGSTAYMVALGRALETIRTDRVPLVMDLYTVKLFLPFSGVLGLKARILFVLGGIVVKFMPATMLLRKSRLLRSLDFMGARTKWIDDQIIHAQDTGCEQFVIVGSGLDARNLRMTLSMKAFEIDFQSMLDMKRKLFARVGSTFSSEVSFVGTDLSLPNQGWQEDLLAAGFERSKKTVWLLEGFTGYLTKDELLPLLTGIARMSAVGSRLIATWIGFAKDKDDMMQEGTLKMHRFFTSDPTKDAMAPAGWSEVMQTGIGPVVHSFLGETCTANSNDMSYRFTVHMVK